MASETQKMEALKGGEFLIKDSDPQSVFIPEEITDDQKLMAQAAREFVEKEITPKLDAIDHQEPGLVQGLLEKAGELGLLVLRCRNNTAGLAKILIPTHLLQWNWDRAIRSVCLLPRIPVLALCLFFITERKHRKKNTFLSLHRANGSRLIV